jgi:predicted DNA-binding transcriptional regulator AlpA
MHISGYELALPVSDGWRFFVSRDIAMAISFAPRVKPPASPPPKPVQLKAMHTKPAPANPIIEDLGKSLVPRLRMRDVTRLLGLSRSTIYNRMKEGTFPQPDGRDGPRVIWWRAGTIKSFL